LNNIESKYKTTNNIERKYEQRKYLKSLVVVESVKTNL